TLDMYSAVMARAVQRVLIAHALDEVEDRVPHHELAHELAVEQRAPLERDVHERKREERLGVRSDLDDRHVMDGVRAPHEREVDVLHAPAVLVDLGELTVHVPLHEPRHRGAYGYRREDDARADCCRRLLLHALSLTASSCGRCKRRATRLSGFLSRDQLAQ